MLKKNTNRQNSIILTWVPRVNGTIIKKRTIRRAGGGAAAAFYVVGSTSPRWCRLESTNMIFSLLRLKKGRAGEWTALPLRGRHVRRCHVGESTYSPLPDVVPLWRVLKWDGHTFEEARKMLEGGARSLRRGTYLRGSPRGWTMEGHQPMKISRSQDFPSQSVNNVTFAGEPNIEESAQCITLKMMLHNWNGDLVRFFGCEWSHSVTPTANELGRTIATGQMLLPPPTHTCPVIQFQDWYIFQESWISTSDEWNLHRRRMTSESYP